MMKTYQKLAASVALTIGLVATFGISDAQMRRLDKIPSRAAANQNLPNGAALVRKIAPVPIEEVEAAAEAVVDSWNNPATIGDIFVDGKFDKRRFERAMITEVPRDARLELESVRSVQTLQQMIVAGEEVGQGPGFVRVSTVSATLSTRLIVNDPDVDFVNMFGLNEVRFQVVEKLGGGR